MKPWPKRPRPLPGALLAAACWLLLCAAPGGGLAEDYPLGDRDTMWADPFLIGSQRHFAEIYSTRGIAPGGTPSALPRGRPVEALAYGLFDRRYGLEDYFELTRTTGLIVLKEGRVVFERYRLGADERSLFMSHSVAKSLVSTLVGFAIGDGLIGGVEDPISDYLPELKGTGYDGVPIKAVLQMSSGVGFTEDYLAVQSDFGRMWQQSVQANSTPIRAFVRAVRRLYPPFERFHYAAVETVALGWLVARVTGKTLSAYLSEKLWGPLGMEAEANWATDGQGPEASELAFCCLSATLRDYARFGLLMAQRGAWQGRQLLPPGWVEEATRPDRPQVQPGRLEPGSPLGYQYQWWTLPGTDGAFVARGVRGQFIHVNPAEKLVIVVTGAWPVWWSSTLEAHSLALFEAFAARLRE